MCVFKLSSFHKVQWLHFTSEVDKSSDVTFLLDLVTKNYLYRLMFELFKAVLSQKMTAQCACAILMQYRYDPAIKVRSSDVNKGVIDAMPKLRTKAGLKVFAPKFLHVPLGICG